MCQSAELSLRTYVYYIGNPNEVAIYSFPDTQTLLSSALQMEPPTGCPTLEFILILLYVIGVIYMFGPIAEPKNSDFRLMTKRKTFLSLLSLNV
jgi:hypothetical protein